MLQTEPGFLAIPLVESYRPELVLLSLAVIFFAGFTSLSLADRMLASFGRIRTGWLLGAAIALGGGIWSMHFVAMLAFQLPMPINYAPGLTVISLLVAIIFVTVGLLIVSWRPDSRIALAAAGILTGLGVSAMHYTGMAAMRMGALIIWYQPLVLLSVLIGMVAATAALWLSLQSKTLAFKLVAATAMTIAVAGMHYTGMAAANYVPAHGALSTGTDLQPGVLAVAVAAASFIILFLALLAAMVDQTLANRARAEAERLRDLNEKLEGMVGTRTVELLKAKQRAERASNAKTDFLASISHELRTPLNAVIGYSEILIEEAEENGLTGSLEDIEKIRTAGRHILALVNDILDLSKIEAGKMEVYIERVALKDILDDAVTVCRRMLDENGNRCIVEHAAAIDRVDTDVTKLRQALINLLGNAAKFTRNGTVTLATRLAERDGADWIEITVHDTGIGIAPEHQEGVFDEFQRGDSNVARHHGGTGLGLALSRRLIRLLGGDITLASQPGTGSVFTIAVPARGRLAEAAD
ncbi:MHYT domain-containing protein [Ferrovibrio sp.]|uniref:MHYT domain-containing protein n=1 Tax=Ferrovibrio sp. TaxID=1917215 RepID=UPI0031201D2C